MSFLCRKRQEDKIIASAAAVRVFSAKERTVKLNGRRLLEKNLIKSLNSIDSNEKERMSGSGLMMIRRGGKINQ